MVDLDRNLPFVVFVLITLAVLGVIIGAPVLTATGQPAAASLLYLTASTSCHQLTGRSYCIMQGESGWSIGDCQPQDGVFKSGTPTMLDGMGMTAYKFAMCARNTAIFAGLLLGALGFAVWTRGRLESEEWPNKWLLVAALVPIAIDGTTQLVMLRESTNTLRLATGGLAGFALSFYLIPILNTIWRTLKERR